MDILVFFTRDIDFLYIVTAQIASIINVVPNMFRNHIVQFETL